MENRVIVQKLAIERCRLSISHICALHHMAACEMGDEAAQTLNGLLENLRKDLAVIEKLVSE